MANSLDQERTLKEKLDTLNTQLAEEDKIAEEERKKKEAIKAEEDRKKDIENTISKAKEDRLKKERIRFSESFRREGDTVYFGVYPQSKRAKNVIVFDEKTADGYHKASDGQFYAFDEKKGIYYKVEQIKWKVLYESDTEFKLISDKILDFNYNEYGYDFSYGYHFNKDIILKNILDTAFDKYTVDPHICDIGFLNTHELEYINKEKRKRLPTDYAMREKDSSVWLIEGPNNTCYKLNAFKNAKKVKKLKVFGLVPCINVKKFIDIADVKEKCIYWHRVCDQDWYIELKKLPLPVMYVNELDILVSPGDKVKKGDIILKGVIRYGLYHLDKKEFFLKAMSDGTVVSVKSEFKGFEINMDTELVSIV